MWVSSVRAQLGRGIGRSFRQGGCFTEAQSTKETYLFGNNIPSLKITIINQFNQVKLSLRLIKYEVTKHYAMKAYGAVDV
jgi:hypothetical protein